MNIPSNGVDQEALRAEIMCAIAAGRELGPEMDEHIAASAIEKYLAAHPKAPPVVVPAEPRVTADGVMLRLVAVGLGGGTLAALVVAHVWFMFWLVIPIMAMLLITFRSGRGRRMRYQGDPDAEQREWDERRRYREARHRYEIEKLEAKRAFLKGVAEFGKGFGRTMRDQKGRYY
jgi:hypothetical protein